MDIRENFREGLRSINANLLRSVLTAAIVAIGITSLVGILTAIDGIQQSVTDSLSDLGVNKFDIRQKFPRGGRVAGKAEKVYPRLTIDEVTRFDRNFNYPAIVSIYTPSSGGKEVKSGSKKTNPSTSIMAADDDYLLLQGYDLEAGRNFSPIEIQYGSNVAIIGSAIRDDLFDSNEEALESEISAFGTKYKVIGILAEQGGMDGGSTDNTVILPLMWARRLAGDISISYRISVGIDNPVAMEEAMGEATGVMRVVRQDRIGDENSFEISRSESLAEQLSDITSVMRIAGFGIGFITLLGAAIALMNIMMVSVTERTREVGIRKALGATPKKIRLQFLIEAIVVCLLGGFAGVILGILIGNLTSSIIGLEIFIVPWFWMFVGMMICIFVGIISGYYPAYKASKVDPIESLRFE